MQKTLPIVLFLFVLALFTACEKESLPASEFSKQKEYYPLVPGKYIDFQYDSIVYDENGTAKYAYSGFIREKIDTLLKDSESEKQYRLIKYWRKDSTDLWLITDVETITVTDNQLIRTEENLPFIRLVFPPEKNKRWNGNALFDENIIVKFAGESIRMFQGWEYKITDKDYTASIGQADLDSLVRVEEVNDAESIFSLRYSSQVYAKGIGPVKREMKIYDTQRPQPGKAWEEYAEKGFSLVQTMISHN